MKFETKEIPLEKIQLNEGQIPQVGENPRQISKDGLKRMVESIKKFPDMLKLRELIVYPIGDKYIAIGGNQRLKALKEIKAKDAPCKVLDEQTSAERLREIVIKDNLEVGEWDYNKLMDWDLPELQEWALPEIDKIIKAKEVSPDDVQEDDVPEDAPTRCKTGDVWILGSHRLMCGDSTIADDMARLMRGEEANLLLTDPPYNVALGSHDTPEEARKRHRRTDGLLIANDEMPDDKFVEFLVSVFKNSYSNMKPGAAFYIWHADNQSYNFRKSLIESGIQLRQTLIWVKNTFTLGRQDYQWIHEPCLYGWKDGAAHYFIDDRTLSSVFQKELQFDKIKKEEAVELLKKIYSTVKTTVIYEDKPTKSEIHPTMKPVKLFARLIHNSTRTGELVLDPFGGSGTSIIACEQMERRCYSMELSPTYCDAILTRWELLTKSKAIKEEL